MLAVGKLKKPWLQQALDDYRDRIGRHVRVEYITVREEPVHQHWSRTEIERAVSVEGERLLARIPDSSIAVALDETGKQWTSTGLARFIASREQSGTTGIAFVIGGTAGLAPAVLARSDRVWSLSRLTLTHQLVPIVLAEQIYRAYKINRGEPYHW